MAASFPTSVKSFGADAVNGDYVLPAHVNDLRAEMVAVENYLIPLGMEQNLLINGGFDFAQRQVPGTLTAVADNKYGADRWRMTRANADVQYQRNDALGEAGLTSKYYGLWKKITNTGKLMVTQIVEGVNSVPMRSKNLIFQVKLKASANTTMRMAVFELQNAGTIDTIPAALVAAWGADGVDPTMGANIAALTAVSTKAVTTSWANYSIQVTGTSNLKNLIVAVWTNAGVAANTTLSMAEAKLSVDRAGAVTTWTPRAYQQELELCQRYYEKSHNVDLAPGDVTTTAGCITWVSRAADQLDRVNIRFKVEKLGTPTATLYAVTSGTAAKWRNTTGGADLSALTGDVGQYAFTAYPGANTTANNIFAWNWTAESEL